MSDIDISPEAVELSGDSLNLADEAEQIAQKIAKAEDAIRQEALKAQARAIYAEMDANVVKVTQAVTSASPAAAQSLVDTINKTGNDIDNASFTGQPDGTINGAQVDVARAAEANATAEVKQTMEAMNKAFLKSFEDIKELIEYQGMEISDLNERVEQLQTDLADSKVASDKVASDANELAEELDGRLEKNTAMKEKITAKEGEKGWSTWKKVLILIMVFGMTIAGLCLWSWSVARAKTGCYLYSSGKSSKLNCSGWYKKGGNAVYCRCGTLSDIGAPPPDCSKFSGDECKYPYCLGNACSPKEDPGGYGICAGGNLPQCTDNPDLTADGSVSYGYNDVPWYSPMAGLPAAIVNTPKDLAQGFLDMLLAFLKKMGGMLIIVVIGIIALLIIYRASENYFEGKESKESSTNK